MKKLALNNDYPITKINSQFGDIKISPQSNGDIWVWKGKELRLTLNNDEILPFINGLKKCLNLNYIAMKVSKNVTSHGACNSEDELNIFRDGIEFGIKHSIEL